jgi:cytoskeletal protein CcmA (bactofilin family)
VLKQIINQQDSSDPADKAAEEAPAPAKPRLSVPLGGITGGKNILSSDVEIKGKLRFSNDLIIDGRIEGEVNSEGDLTVGENATIVGDVKTRSVVVYGRVEGNITVTDRCELKRNATLHGDVVAGKLAIEEGATFMGTSTVGTPKSGAKHAAATPPAGGSGDGF